MHLSARKAKHAQARDFAHALGNIDVCEVVENDEGQRRGRDHQHDDNRIHHREHGPVELDRLGREGHG